MKRTLLALTVVLAALPNAALAGSIGLLDPVIQTIDQASSLILTDTLIEPIKDPITTTIKDPITTTLKDPITTTIKDPITTTTKDSTASVKTVPEPASLVLLGVGALGLGLARRRLR